LRSWTACAVAVAMLRDRKSGKCLLVAGDRPRVGFRCLGASVLCQAQTRLAADPSNNIA